MNQGADQENEDQNRKGSPKLNGSLGKHMDQHGICTPKVGIADGLQCGALVCVCKLQVMGAQWYDPHLAVANLGWLHQHGDDKCCKAAKDSNPY